VTARPHAILVHRPGCAGPGGHTVPTYRVEAGAGGAARAHKLVPSDRRAVGAATVDRGARFPGTRRTIWPTLAPDVQADIAAHGNVAGWAIAIEVASADRDPTFDAAQIEVLAGILAFEAVVHSIPLVWLDQWHGAGIGGHTAPFPFPFTTADPDLECPGAEQVRQLRDVVLPRAAERAAAWRAPAR